MRFEALRNKQEGMGQQEEIASSAPKLFASGSGRPREKESLPLRGGPAKSGNHQDECNQNMLRYLIDLNTIHHMNIFEMLIYNWRYVGGLLCT